jgi:hypothetical protein
MENRLLASSATEREQHAWRGAITRELIKYVYDEECYDRKNFIILCDMWGHNIFLLDAWGEKTLLVPRCVMPPFRSSTFLLAGQHSGQLEMVISVLLDSDSLMNVSFPLLSPTLAGTVVGSAFIDVDVNSILSLVVQISGTIMKSFETGKWKCVEKTTWWQHWWRWLCIDSTSSNRVCDFVSGPFKVLLSRYGCTIRGKEQMPKFRFCTTQQINIET